MSSVLSKKVLAAASALAVATLTLTSNNTVFADNTTSANGLKKNAHKFPSLSLSEPDRDLFELKQVHVIMRHGSRSTCGKTPGQTEEQFGQEWIQCHDEESNEPMSSEARRPCKVGQLTVAGEAMCYELGRRLRARYNDDLGFITDEFDENEMEFGSTIVPRARYSLRRTLDALFTAKPVPQEYLDAHQDENNILHPDFARCTDLANHFLSTQEKIISSHKNDPVLLAMEEKVNKAANAPVMDSLTWMEIGDWATSRAFHGIPLIPNLPRDFLPVAEGAAWETFQGVLTDSTKVIRLGIGKLVSDIVDRISNVTSDDSTLTGDDKNGNHAKFVIYSGHDTTIVPLASAFGIPLLSWPPYSTHIEVEVWKSKNAKMADGYRDVCLHGIQRDQLHNIYYNNDDNISSAPTLDSTVVSPAGSVARHSEQHLISNVPLDTFPAYGIVQESSGATKPLNGNMLSHILAENHKPTPFVDEYWVRVIFNGSVVSAVPLSHFKRNVARYMSRDDEKRIKECGTFDASKSFRWR